MVVLARPRHANCTTSLTFSLPSSSYATTMWEYIDLTLPPLLSLISHIAYRKTHSSLQKIQTAIPYPSTKDDSMDGKYVVVEGRVGLGDEKPIGVQGGIGVEGVIYEVRSYIPHFVRRKGMHVECNLLA